jgi:AraC-like DNA-binding protein
MKYCKFGQYSIMLKKDIQWETVRPAIELTDFVESFWKLDNPTDQEHQIVVLPDGRIDIIFSSKSDGVLQATIKGIDTEPDQTIIAPHTIFFAVSFKLLGVEFLLENKVNNIINQGVLLPNGFWGIRTADLDDFSLFCEKVSRKIRTLISKIKPVIDRRKFELFDLIYQSNGTLPVKDFAEKVFWESRQINRYFNKQFGIPLKTYCNILRFKSSLNHIKKGKLYPELSYADQNHFIREVKRMAGVTPKELSRNKNDRFILLSSL